MVQDAKLVAININDNNAVSHWRESNRTVSTIKYKITYFQIRLDKQILNQINIFFIIINYYYCD